jgi:hypothetical protein
MTIIYARAFQRHFEGSLSCASPSCARPSPSDISRAPSRAATALMFSYD